MWTAVTCTQLTKDAAEKHNLQWSPDGQSLFYISGKCVQSVTVPEGVISTGYLLHRCRLPGCFQDLTGRLAGGHQPQPHLYVVPFDLATLKSATHRIQLEDMKGIFTYGGAYQAPTKNVLWSSDGKKMAIDTLSPSAGKQLDLILVFDISNCTSTTPCNQHHALPTAG